MLRDVATPRLGTAFVAATVSGFAVYVNGLAVRRFDDATVYTTAKNTLAAAILLAGLAMARRAVAPARLDPVARRRLAAIAVVGGSVPFVLFFEGLRRASSTDAAFIHKTLVVWVAVGATIRLGERVSSLHAGAIVLLVGGHLVLTGGIPRTIGAGEAMIAAATLFWTIEILIVKRLLTDVPAEIASVARMAGGAVVLVAWVAARGDLASLWSFDRVQWTWLLLTGVTLAGFVASWYRALSLAPAVDVTAVLVVGAVITGALNVAFRGAPITAGSLGYVLMVCGVVAVVAARPPIVRPQLQP